MNWTRKSTSAGHTITRNQPSQQDEEILEGLSSDSFANMLCISSVDDDDEQGKNVEEDENISTLFVNESRIEVIQMWSHLDTLFS